MHPTEVPGIWSVAAAPGGARCWAWAPEQLADLGPIRRELREGLAGEPHRPGAGQPEVHARVMTTLDELLSNALRHGRAPVCGEVRRTEDHWVVEVCDHAAGVGPRPTFDRDPARGGMGLRMILDLSTARGWFVDDGVKHVWATLLADTAPAG